MPNHSLKAIATCGRPLTTLRGLLASLGATLLLSTFFAGAPAHAADAYPSRPVRIIVPYAPGGSVDLLARALGAKLSERWKREVIIDNKAGASEIIGATAVANAKPDGYTLLLGTDVGLQSNEFLFSKLAYGPSSFSPVIRIAETPLVLVVRTDSPYNTMAQLVEAAKRAPGKISYGSSGVGGHVHIALNWLGVKAGVQFNHVPFKGGAPAVQGLLSGDVDLTAVPYAAVETFIKSNMLRPIAVSSARRIPVLSTVPSLTELGYEVNVQVLNALVAPANTPKEIVTKIADDVRQIVVIPDFAAQNIDRYGYFTIGDTPAEFADYLVKDRDRRRARIAAANVKLD